MANHTCKGVLNIKNIRSFSRRDTPYLRTVQVPLRDGVTEGGGVPCEAKDLEC